MFSSERCHPAEWNRSTPGFQVVREAKAGDILGEIGVLVVHSVRQSVSNSRNIFALKYVGFSFVAAFGRHE
ncbi:hypothetical protein V6N12_009608 [Hibiscus sabdariffa]|uniref:Cyclic nucleotide-binding domain-containing protein n=1 Tax=Hibiscus sabdariffa TaxID=183260 RepID=A0ABR1ZVX6_9ROSI